MNGNAVFSINSVPAEMMRPIVSKMNQTTMAKLRRTSKTFNKFIEDNRRSIDVRVKMGDFSCLYLNADSQITLHTGWDEVVVEHFPREEIQCLIVDTVIVKNAKTREQKAWIVDVLDRSRLQSSENVVYNNVDFNSNMSVWTKFAEFIEGCTLNGLPFGEIGVAFDDHWSHLQNFQQLEVTMPSFPTSSVCNIANAFLDCRLEGMIGWTFNVAVPFIEYKAILRIPQMRNHVRDIVEEDLPYTPNEILALFSVQNRVKSLLFIWIDRKSVHFGRVSNFTDQAMTSFRNVMSNRWGCLRRKAKKL